MKRAFILTIGLVFMHFSAIAQLTEQQQIQKLNYVYQQLRNNYVDDVPLEPLVEEAIKATLKQLDPHSTYLSREQIDQMRTRLRGDYAGIGIKYIIHNDTVVVRSIMPNSPAELVDIAPNDRIVAIDGRNVVGIPIDSVASLFKGEVNTSLNIEVARRVSFFHETITVRRETIDNGAISASFRVGNVGYISVSAFSKPVASEFYAAYRRLGDVEALIVDLRNNSGGAITSAIDLTGLFLKKGDVIVSTEGRSHNIVYDKREDGAIIDIPIVVIINENSASASEIFAGAIQDHDRGVIVGHTSFGKGLVQEIIDLKDGSALCLTIARYKTPSGRIIQRPYTLGQNDDYIADSLRYMHPDSIAHDSKLMYTTLKLGRKVYGGGGITPDVYIDNSTINLSDKLLEAYTQAVFEHTDIDIWDCTSNYGLFLQYDNVDKFDTGYKISDRIMELFYRNANLKAEELTEFDQHFITTMIKATMAERLYGEWARYYIYNKHLDPMAQRAVEIAKDNTLYEQILNSMGK